MGETVYVLMSHEGSKSKREWRPVAVVTNPDIAAQWIAMGGRDPEQVDWIPLELDEFTHIGPENMPEFRPQPVDPTAQQAVETAKRLEDTNARLLETIKQLQKQLGIKLPKPVKQPTSALLKKNGTISKEASDGSDNDISGSNEG